MIDKRRYIPKLPRQRVASKPDSEYTKSGTLLKPKEGWTDHWRSVMWLSLPRKWDAEAGEVGYLHVVRRLNAKEQPG